MKFTGTDSYVASDDLRVAVNAAIALQRPLLIKGEPGTGKTVLAHEVAKAISAPLIEWHIKSTTKAQQGLYEYDAVSRLRDSQLGDERVKDIRNYIKRGKLWDAFTAAERPVLLIDEIDKADIEFPNDLLLELDRMEFYVYETQEVVKAVQRPVVMITSNNEKELPDAFLRRCFFHYIRFPDREIMTQIVDVHFPDLQLIVMPKVGDGTPPFVGSLAGDILEHYDVEMDFAGRKLNFFSKDHCPGKVIYWKADAYAVVPVTLQIPTPDDSRRGFRPYSPRGSHINVPVTINGKNLTAALNTSSLPSTMSTDTAKYMFGVTAESPGAVPIESPDGDPRHRMFRYTFPSLTFDEVTVSNAKFLIYPNLTGTKDPNNVMTYEPLPNNGSKLTVSNPSKPGTEWSYETFFDGKFRPVAGQKNSETAVEIINDKSIRIYNKRDGVVYQVVINTLSDDNNTINNEYIRMDKDGKITGVTHVTYNRRKK